MLEFLRDPIWQFFGVILAILSIGVALWIYLHQRQIKELAFGLVSSRRLLAVSDEVSSRVKVELDGRPVNNVHLLVYALKNTGHRAISPSDFQKMLTISFNEGTIVSAEIASQTPRNLNASIRNSESFVELQPLLLNAGDQLFIQILLSASNPEVIVDARIIDVPNLVSINTKPRLPPIMESGLPFFFGFLTLATVATYLIEVNGWWHYIESKPVSTSEVPDVARLPVYVSMLGLMLFGVIQISIMRIYEKYGPASRRYVNEN